MLSSISVATTCLEQFWFIHGDRPILGNPNDTACWPLALHVTASPATCPNGYHAACSGATITSQKVEHCCPIGYICDLGYYSCVSKVGSLTTANGTSVDSNNQTVVQLISFSIVNANSVAVQYADSDTLVTIPPPSISSTDSTAATPLPTTSLPLPTSSAMTVPDPSTGQTGGLSTGVKAGIGVGVGIAVLLLVGLLVFFRFRHKAASKSQAAASGVNPEQDPQRQDVPSAAAFQENYQHQLYQQGQYPSQPQELPDAAPAIHELNAKYAGVEKSSSRDIGSQPSELSAEGLA